METEKGGDEGEPSSWRKELLKSSLAESLSDAGAKQFSMKDLTSESLTL
jgi:hypothetical protein